METTGAPVATRAQINAIGAMLVQAGHPIEEAGERALAMVYWSGYDISKLEETTQLVFAKPRLVALPNTKENG